MPELTEPMNETERPRGFGGTPDPEPATNEDGDELATPEEQANYDLLVIRSRKMIYGPAQDDVLELLSAAESPAQGMGQAGSMILKSLVSSARESGREIDGSVVLAAGAEVVQDLNDLAKAKGVYEYDAPKDEEQQVTDALMWGAKYYGDGALASGELTPEMRAQAQKQMQEGLAAEKGQQVDPPVTAQPTKIAQGVNQAMSPPPGIVGGQMGGM